MGAKYASIFIVRVSNNAVFYLKMKPFFHFAMKFYKKSDSLAKYQGRYKKLPQRVKYCILNTKNSGGRTRTFDPGLMNPML